MVGGLSGCSPGQADAGWFFDPRNPLLGGRLGVCFDAAVMKVAPLYRMWFSWRTHRSIGYTESTDAIRWSRPRIVLAPEEGIGETDVNRPSVLARDGALHMWFTSQTPDSSVISYAVSNDGDTWRRLGSHAVFASEVPWEKRSVMCPNVLWDDALGCYRMYYSGGEQYEPDSIGLATSLDGLQWTRRPSPVFTADPAHDWERTKVTGSDVHKLHDWYYMFYIGFADVDHAAIGIARSRDGVSGWQRHPQNPILRAPGISNPVAWDRDAIYKPSALLDDHRWLLFFNARRHHTEQIGLAIHPGIDLGF